MRLFVLILATLMTASCVPSQPIVTDYNGDSVKIIQTNLAGEGARVEATDAEAQRICAKGSRKTAEYASSRSLPTYEVEHLYLCL